MSQRVLFVLEVPVNLYISPIVGRAVLGASAQLSLLRDGEYPLLVAARTNTGLRLQIVEGIVTRFVGALIVRQHREAQ